MEASSAPAVKENVFGGGIAGCVGFGKRVGHHAVPIEFAVRFLDALSVAVVGVGNTGSAGELIFGVVVVSWRVRRAQRQRTRSVQGEIACGVVAVADELIFGRGG